MSTVPEQGIEGVTRLDEATHTTVSHSKPLSQRGLAVTNSLHIVHCDHCSSTINVLVTNLASKPQMVYKGTSISVMTPAEYDVKNF